MKLFSLFSCLFFFLLLYSPLYSQELYEDGSMMLSEISDDTTYGYQPMAETSIKVGTISAEYTYVKELLGPNGEETKANRIGSCCRFETKNGIFGMGLLDKWEITYEGQTQPVVIYINGYDPGTPKCPYGLTFKKAENHNKIYRFPEDSIVKVSICESNKIYSVENATMTEAFGKLTKPSNAPAFKGGLEELQKFFTENPLRDERTKDITFKLSIFFTVNCVGQSGNYRILTRGKGMYESFANQVLQTVNRMPRNWIAATKKKKEVDCYQVLYFIVENGLLNVSYK